MAGNNPNNTAYANYAMGNAVANSNLGRTIGVKPNANGVITYPNAAGLPAGHVVIQPSNGYTQPNYTQPSYTQPSVNYGSPVLSGPGMAPSNGAYVVPITKAP